MTSLDLSDLISVLRSTGLYYNFSGLKHEHFLNHFQLFRLVFFVCATMATLTSLIYGEIYGRSSTIEIFFGFVSTVMTIKHVHLYQMRSETEEVIRLIMAIRVKFQQGTDVEFRANTQMSWNGVRIYTMMIKSFIIFYVTVPSILDLFIWIVYDTPYAYRLPMPMDSFLDEKPVRDLKYFLVTILTIAWTGVGTYAHLGLDIFLIIACSYYASLVKTFCAHMDLDTSSPPEKLEAVIKEHAAHLQALHSLSPKFIRLFGYPYAVQNIVGSLSICTLLYALTSPGTSAFSFLFFAMIFLTILLFGNLVNAAYIGQYATDQSSLIFDSLYDLPWYNLRPAERKYFITMICASRKPFTIHYHGRSPLDFKNFMSILNTSYSYFMFIKSAMK